MYGSHDRAHASSQAEKRCREPGGILLISPGFPFSIYGSPASDGLVCVCLVHSSRQSSSCATDMRDRPTFALRPLSLALTTLFRGSSALHNSARFAPATPRFFDVSSFSSLPSPLAARAEPHTKDEPHDSHDSGETCVLRCLGVLVCLQNESAVCSERLTDTWMAARTYYMGVCKFTWEYLVQAHTPSSVLLLGVDWGCAICTILPVYRTG